MRILFLTLYPDIAASPRYRVAQYAPYLRANGMECHIACALTEDQFLKYTGPRRNGRPFWYHFHELPQRFGQVLRAAAYDVVVVQKAIMSAYVRGAVALLRKRARRLVYDIDDAVHLAPPHPLRGLWRPIEDRCQIYKLFAAADLVLAGNPWLVRAAEDAGAHAALLPTVVDTDRFVPASQSPDTYRIGWIGNPSTMVCLEPALEALRAVPDAQVCLIGADPARNPLPNTEIRPWSLEHEVTELRRFAVGILPLPKQEWMRGKCALKALQYMACGIPCVATPFGAVCDIIRDGENGLFADSTSEWLAAFDRLRDASERRRLGRAGRETVETRYALKYTAPRFIELLESLA